MPVHDATLEKATLLSTFFGKFGLLLEIEFLNFRSFIRTHIACTLFETFCVVHWSLVIAIPRNDTDVRKSIGLPPSFSRVFSTLRKILQHLWVLKIFEIVVILELINLFQTFLIECFSIVMHLIGLPFCWVFVTVGNQAAVVPIVHWIVVRAAEF